MGLTADQQKWCDEIVERALALDAELRDAFVSEACGGDEELHQEALALLSIGPATTAVFDVSPAACLMPPHFGRYRTEELIGSGGMSMVYRALDPVIHRHVAIKVMARRVEASAEEYQRFLTELHLLGSLGHPNIVQVFDAGDHQGSPFIVMEYLQGENLAESIAQGHCAPFASKLSIARYLAEALQRVHEAHVCHRDVKPANVFLERTGRVKLMDFGVSARLDGPRLTQTGALIGTLPYLAPEQIRGEKTGPSVDIYAFGVLLFELFTGSKPFSGAAAELLYKIAHEPIPLAPLAKLPSPLIELIRSCTAKEATARPDNFGRIREVLERISQGRGDQAHVTRRSRRIAVAAAALAAIMLAGWYGLSGVRHSTLTTRNPAVSPDPVSAIAGPTPKSADRPESGPANLTPPKLSPGEVKPAKSSPLEANPGGVRQREEDRPVASLAPPPGRTPATSPSPANEPAAPVNRPHTEIQIATAPALPPTDVVKLPDSIAGLKEPPRKPEPPVAATAVTPAAQLKLADSQRIREVLARFAAGYNEKNAILINRIYPSGPDLKRLEEIFTGVKTMDYQLVPESEPEIEGDQAKVRCRRAVSQVPFERSVLRKQIPVAKQTTAQNVLVRLERRDGTWKITSIQ